MADINDAFDDIVFAEDRMIQRGYEEGFAKGSTEENVEGYHLGYHRGAEIGAELGYYNSVVRFYLAQKKEDSKIVACLSAIEKAIEEFPRANDESDYLSKLEWIRAQYRKSCSLLKIDGAFPESDRMNF